MVFPVPVLAWAMLHGDEKVENSKVQVNAHMSAPLRASLMVFDCTSVISVKPIPCVILFTMTGSTSPRVSRSENAVTGPEAVESTGASSPIRAL